MSTLVIIGQSPAAHAAIVTLRSNRTDWDITLISTDGELPYDRALFPGMLDRTFKEKDIFCSPADYYKDNNIRVILDKELSRVNFNRHKVFLADKVQVDYDALIIADAPQIRLPEIKGLRRQGVFHLARLGSVRSILKRIPLVETAVIVPSSLRGIETALALKKAGKEVLIILAEGAMPAMGLIDTVRDSFLKLADKSRLRIMFGCSVEDVLGESEVQAVRLDSGKVMACEMVILEETVPDLRFLSDGALLIQQRICVHTTMRTNIPDVYAVDAMMELADPRFVGTYSLDTEMAVRQGECACKAILGQEAPFQLNCPDPQKKMESLFPFQVLTQV